VKFELEDEVGVSPQSVAPLAPLVERIGGSKIGLARASTSTLATRAWPRGFQVQDVVGGLGGWEGRCVSKKRRSESSGQAFVE